MYIVQTLYLKTASFETYEESHNRQFFVNDLSSIRMSNGVVTGDSHRPQLVIVLLLLGDKN